MEPSSARTQVWRIVALIAALLAFSSPTYWIQWRHTWPSFIPSTIALAAIVVALVAAWGRTRVAGDDDDRARAGTAMTIVGAIAVVMIAAGAWRWIGLVMGNPIDEQQADMLPVIRAALRRFLRGRDPYGIYNVPWEAPLGYGPVLWAPFLVPHLLNADLRLASVFGELVVPIWCGIAATAAAARSRLLVAAGWLALIALLFLNPDLSSFTVVAHTPTYWPLLPLFAVLVTAERWVAAAFVLGLIVVGRTTMGAGVPIFLAAVWFKDRPRFVRAVVAFGAPVVALMAPFAIWDPGALWYGMVAVYPRVIKAIVWPTRDGGAVHTIGITGWLLAHRLERFAEATQALAVIATWLVGIRAVQRGARPLPWMVLASLAFCMTTLWPLYYIYFDVLLLIVSGAVAETLTWTVRRQTFMWVGSLGAAALLVAINLLVWTSPSPRIDFRDPSAARWLHKGFGYSALPGESPLPWIWGTEGTVSIARNSTAPADIVIEAQPVLPADSNVQTVSALLNGRPIGTAHASRGWQTLRFTADSAAWLIGANDLELVCATTTPPAAVGLSDEPRHLSLGLRRLEVMPRQ